MSAELADQRLRAVGGELAACRAELEETRAEVALAEGRVSGVERSRVGRVRRWWSRG